MCSIQIYASAATPPCLYERFLRAPLVAGDVCMYVCACGVRGRVRVHVYLRVDKVFVRARIYRGACPQFVCTVIFHPNIALLMW